MCLRTLFRRWDFNVQPPLTASRVVGFIPTRCDTIYGAIVLIRSASSLGRGHFTCPLPSCVSLDPQGASRIAGLSGAVRDPLRSSRDQSAVHLTGRHFTCPSVTLLCFTRPPRVTRPVRHAPHFPVFSNPITRSHTANFLTILYLALKPVCHTPSDTRSRPGRPKHNRIHVGNSFVHTQERYVKPSRRPPVHACMQVRRRRFCLHLLCRPSNSLSSGN